MAQFKILGTLEVVNDAGRSCAPRAPKLRQLMTLLLVNAHQLVHADRLLEELWDEDPPRSAVTTMQTYIYQLRRLIDREQLGAVGEDLLLTRSPGYILCVDPRDVDCFVFQELMDQGRAHLDSGSPREAARLLRQALGMWNGSAATDVQPGRVLDAHLTMLKEQRLRALEMRIKADIERGSHRELIGELRYLVATHPLNEWFHGQLITALSLAGRRDEALRAYHGLRTTLDRELGLEPLPELQRLQYEVLTVGEPAGLGVGTGGDGDLRTVSSTVRSPSH